MPTYRFRNIDTDEVFEKWMYMNERGPYLSENPNIRQVPAGFHSVSEIGDWRNKTSDGWNEVLKKVGTVPGSIVKPLK